MKNSMLSKIICSNYYGLSFREKPNLKEEQLKINISRLRVLAPTLLFINLVLLVVDLTKFYSLWDSLVGYKNLFYLHIIIIIGLFIIIGPLYLSYKGFKKASIKKKGIFVCFSLVFIFIWSITTSINAQLIHGQISAYIIAAFCLSSIFLVNPIKNIIIYFSGHLLFTIGVFLVSNNPQQLSGNIVNSTFLIILAFVIANVNFSNFINDFKNDNTIKAMNLELKKSHENLEMAVKKKTIELERANENLVEEINKRHEIEMNALKSKLAFEKEKNLLNKKIEYEEIRTEFFANISHELKTPLNVIFGSQQMMSLYLKQGLVLDKEGRLDKSIRLIKQNCYRLIRLIGNLIDITKIDVGNYDLHLGNYDIVKIVKEITLSVFDYANIKEIDLSFDTEIDKKIIACDPDKIERIILNLLSNAVKFTPPSGAIFVNMYQEEKGIYISVKDTGIGIPHELQNLVFDRFVQVDKSIKREKEGSGIGLSLVKSLVEIHGGRISLESVPGEGSEFRVMLPDVLKEDDDIVIEEIATTIDEKVEKINLEFSDIYS